MHRYVTPLTLIVLRRERMMIEHIALATAAAVFLALWVWPVDDNDDECGDTPEIG